MAVNAAILATAISSGQFWSGVYGTLNGLDTMVDAHQHPSILYGLLVLEDPFGVIVKDALGYDVYFP